MPIIEALAALVGGGGGAWVAIRAQIRYLEARANEAKAEAVRAHQRIDAHLTHR